MNIQEFTIPKFLESIKDNQAEEEYYSAVYGESFHLTMDLQSRPNLIAKLDPIRRENAGQLVPDFEERISYKFKNYRPTHEYKPGEYYLFRYWILNKKRNIHIRFRTKSDDKLVDDFLEFHQESSNIRLCCNTESLDRRITGKLREAYEEAIADNEHLVDDPQDQMLYVVRNRRMDYIIGIITPILDTMYLMEERGYDLGRVIDEIGKVKIHPTKEEYPLIWNSTFDVLRSKCA